MSHNPNCKCFSGSHIWDLDYDKQMTSERYCICCEHFFASEVIEEKNLDVAIQIMNNIDGADKPITFNKNKGKIKRIL